MSDFKHRYSWQEKSKAPKTACLCRFGGIGDIAQSACALAGLKRAGFHVTMMTTPSGKNILNHDPHIDAWIVQDSDQVLNGELEHYWAAWAKRFDRFVNLSESVEGTLLAMPGRINHMWPHEVRHKYMNRNYLEFCSELAGVPYVPEGKFYASQEEHAQALTFWRRFSGYHIVWPLAGSSLHKFYPHMDSIIAQIMLYIPEAFVVLVGDTACQLLEQGWENEPRVIRASGKLGIRDTLALAQTADLVLGCETGVLNAVAFEKTVDKIVLLSHSSIENLTRDWVNTLSLSALPDDRFECQLRPCHRLHMSDQFCPRSEESFAAMCQQRISSDAVYRAVWKSYNAFKLRRSVFGQVTT
jgi:ADP-heptose:LPS heptosyltransferase